MLENKTQDQGSAVQESGEEIISLKSLADLTGFPVEMIKSELFKSELADEELTLDDLRKAMVNYIDATMLEDANQ